MTAFYQLTDGRLMAVTETIEAGPAKLLKGYVEGVRHVTIRRADEAKPISPRCLSRLQAFVETLQ